ncbi:PepSY-associated TM helix domain-containing protein [Alteraurantiacibacter aestuarii]|uniref:PepSY-associated TM helix domain-containing protein n=1 Tax=Alteraurantiacibacter aestuarii TaxID=650004 RepID=UPI0031E401A2
MSNDKAGADGSVTAPGKPYISPRAKARMLWVTIHRWMGIVLLIPMAVLGVTGSAQVWPEETEALLNPAREVSATADPADISQAHVAAAREALAPYGTISRIEMGEVGEPIIVTSTPYADPPFGIGAPGGMTRQVWLDPASAQVIDNADSAGGFMWYMHFIHGLFLIPGWGRQLVGWMGIFLTVSAITGIYIFWPGKARFMAALKWQKRDGKAMNIHRQSGVILSIVIIVEAITGAWISFPGVMASIVEPGVEQPERRRGGFGPQGDPLVMEDAQWMQALASARLAHDGRPTAISAPVEGGSWAVTLAGEGVNANVAVPVIEGEVTVEESPAFDGPPPAPTRAIAVAGTMRGLHYATIGGIVWQLLVFLSGLVLTFLAVSGVYVWGKRELKRLRKA